MPGHSPLAIAELVKDIITDKVVCDIGCGHGELLVEFKKYAKDVIGLEWDSDVAESAREKGVNVITTDSFYDKLPTADVYYIWTRDSMGVILKAIHEGTKGTFIIGHSIRPSTKKFLEELDAEIRTVGDFKIYITNL